MTSMTDPRSRRAFIRSVTGAAVAATAATACRSTPAQERNRFQTRGVVLLPSDLSLPDWPERAAGAGLTTIALHHGADAGEVVRLLQSEEGSRFMERSRALGLAVEFELHALRAL